MANDRQQRLGAIIPSARPASRSAMGYDFITIQGKQNIIINFKAIKIDNAILDTYRPTAGLANKGLADDYALALNSARYLQVSKPRKSNQ